MSTLETGYTPRERISPYTLREDISLVVPTSGVNEHSLATPTQTREKEGAAWQDVIDHQLVEWGRSVADLEDDGLVPPSPYAIYQASRLAMHFRDQGQPAPMRVVPNGDGGICLERWHGQCFQTIEIRADGTVELITFKDSRLVSRHRLDE